MADEKTTEEKQAMDPVSFAKKMQSAKGVPEERPEGMTESDHNTQILMARQDISDAEKTFEMQVPDATEAQKQQFVEAVITDNLSEEVAAIASGVRTSLEKESKKDGPKELGMKKTVEDGGSGDDSKRDRVGPMSLREAVVSAAEL